MTVCVCMYMKSSAIIKKYMYIRIWLKVKMTTGHWNTPYGKGSKKNTGFVEANQSYWINSSSYIYIHTCIYTYVYIYFIQFSCLLRKWLIFKFWHWLSLLLLNLMFQVHLISLQSSTSGKHKRKIKLTFFYFFSYISVIINIDNYI